MNTKKIFGLAIAVIFFTSGVFAAVDERGIDLYRAEFYDAAKIFFLDQKNLSNTDQAENYYYLGQTYYELQNPDSAAYYYSRSVESDPNYPLGYVGEGMIAMSKRNTKEADDFFKKAIGMAKKDPSVQTAIAEVYLKFNMFPEAIDAVNKAKKINKKYAPALVIEGDIYRAQEKLGDAASSYDDAIRFDPNEKLAYLNSAKLYEHVNTPLALEYLDKVIQIDPNYVPAYALIGDINRSNDKYISALAAYEKIIDIPGVPLLQRERYAQLLYFTDQYEKSLQEINYVLSKDPNNVVMNRLRAYNNYKLENYELGVQQMEEFLSKVPADQHVYFDYTTYGNLLLKVKRNEDAITALEKAATLDSRAEVYKDLIAAYEGMKDYPAAIKQYEKFFGVEPNPTILDYHYYGLDNYIAASRFFSQEYMAATRTPAEQKADDEEFETYFKNGNMAFDKVIEMRPESYLGYLYKGYLNALLDVRAQSDESAVAGAAIPYYEKALEIMLANNEEGQRNKEILEIYRYLAPYYYVQKDYPQALNYFRKILEIQPDNADIKQTIEAIEKM